jgi:hypothetical protein
VAIRPQAGLSYPKAFGGLFVESLAFDRDPHFVLRDLEQAYPNDER